MQSLSDDELSMLAQKWLEGTITSEEKERFDRWYEKQPESKIVLETAEGDKNLFREKIMARILTTTKQPRRTIRRYLPRVAAAAIILLAVGLSYFWWPSSPRPQQTNKQAYDLAPGGNKAVLTLADGRTILLDTTANRQLAILGNKQIIQPASGQLVFQPSGSPALNKLTGTNVLRTPIGGTYQLRLPDGTRVWLNASSSIEFPTTFTGDTRMVKITGEAYFEVVHNAKQPFIVRAANTIIRDIGTRFNVMAYTDESVQKVTLQEGAVEVSAKGSLHRQHLSPGQQVQVTPAGKFTLIKHTDADAAASWKEGRFNFQDANLQEVMRQLARWYNVQVIYENGVPDLEFIGQIERDLPLSEVLKGLKMSGVHFKLETGRRLIVLPR